MKARQSIQNDLVHLQQRLLRERQSSAGHAAVEGRLCRVRERNHAVLRTRFAHLLQQPELVPAANFFFEHLYPIHWPRWRDSQCLRTFPRMCRVMPLAACEVLLQAVELDWLTHEVDARSIDEDPDHQARLHEIRLQQRDRVVALGRGLVAVARLPMMTLLLKCTAPVARRQGLAELHAFFAAGLAAFLAMPDPHALLDEIAALPL